MHSDDQRQFVHMTPRLAFWLIVCLLAFAAAAPAGERLAICASFRSEHPAAHSWHFRLGPRASDTQVRLSFHVRVEEQRLSGSAPWMRVSVNGQPIEAQHLLNKPVEFLYRGDLDLAWARGDRWRAVYSPSFEPDPQLRQKLYGVIDPFQYVWDVTNFVRPGRNRLEIEHLPAMSPALPLVLADIALEVGATRSAPVDRRVQPAPDGPLPTFVPEDPRPVPIRAALSHTGGLTIYVNEAHVAVSTRISLPHGQWKVSVPEGRRQTLQVGETAHESWHTDVHHVHRVVAVHADRVAVADTITNRTHEVIGVIVEHRLRRPCAPKYIRLAGREPRSLPSSYRLPAHPSAFASWEDLSVGLVAEDDVFRVHVKSFAEQQAIGLADDQLGIPAGASLQLEWSIYPLEGDYWDFVNAVRRNWRSDITIPGPLAFQTLTERPPAAEHYLRSLRRCGTRIISTNIPQSNCGNLAHGTAFRHATDWIRMHEKWIPVFRAIAPDIDVLVYFHAQISTEPDASRLYEDARLLDAAGAQVMYPYRDPLPVFIPTHNNSYGRALQSYVHIALDTLQASGLYWDELAYSVTPWAWHAPWDGCTAIIDETSHELVGRRSSVPLLMQQFKLELIDELRRRGCTLIANTQPVTRTLQSRRIIRFVETATYSNLIDAHLGCPLGLANHHPESTTADVARSIRRILEHGGLYYGFYYRRDPPAWDCTTLLYPTTPIDIRPSMMFGRERIITARSGRFGWPDGAAADVYVVNGDGSRVRRPDVADVQENGRHLYEIRMPSDHFAILVRRDQPRQRD